VGHAAHMLGVRNWYTTLVQKLEGKKELERIFTAQEIIIVV
jgi:hypothetical protein